MKKELKEYYHRLIDMSASISGVDGEEMKSRLKIITPIYHDRFPVKNFLFLYFAILCNDYFNFFCFVFMGILSFPIVFITKNIFQFALYLNSKIIYKIIPLFILLIVVLLNKIFSRYPFFNKVRLLKF